MKNRRSKRKQKVGDIFCLYCGERLDAEDRLVIDSRKKYCSKLCQQTAARRRMSARLGVPCKISKLDPLYFD